MTFQCGFCDEIIGFDPAGYRDGDPMCASCKSDLGTIDVPFGVTD